MDIDKVWRRSKRESCECTTCFYCDRPIDHHEHDHYPVSRRRGGVETVVACVICHDLKDRISLVNIDQSALRQAVGEIASVAPKSLWGGLTSDLPQFIKQVPSDAKITPMLVVATSIIPAVENSWSDLSPLARILVARLREFAEEAVIDGIDQSSLIDELDSLSDLDVSDGH